jgi:malonyl-CoA/methylmalonyl-CoA synthetase
MMVSGSMALPASTMARWRDATAHQLLERYGMTELGMALTVPYRGLRVEGSVGRPFAGVQARLLLKETDADKGGDGTWAMGPGELLIRGPNVFKEYYNRRTATEESFVQDPDHVAYDLPNSQRWFEVAPKWFLTGDVAAVDHQGNICLQGRASVDILKISGYKVILSSRFSSSFLIQ